MATSAFVVMLGERLAIDLLTEVQDSQTEKEDEAVTATSRKELQMLASDLLEIEFRGIFTNRLLMCYWNSRPLCELLLRIGVEEYDREGHRYLQKVLAHGREETEG